VVPEVEEMSKENECGVARREAELRQKGEARE